MGMETLHHFFVQGGVVSCNNLFSMAYPLKTTHLPLVFPTFRFLNLYIIMCCRLKVGTYHPFLFPFESVTNRTHANSRFVRWHCFSEEFKKDVFFFEMII